YEAFSGTVLLTRTVTGQSTTLSISPDGARFMAGSTLYDTQSLNVVAQMSPANIPFSFAGAFNTLPNIGGSVISPDGSTLYSAVRVAQFTQRPLRTQASTLLVADPRNLAVTLGIKMPESIVAKMAITSDGADAWGMSESGLIPLPLSTLFDYPILQPETTTVF